MMMMMVHQPNFYWYTSSFSEINAKAFMCCCLPFLSSTLETLERRYMFISILPSAFLPYAIDAIVRPANPKMSQHLIVTESRKDRKYVTVP